ncbi:membrane protein [Rhodobacter phage RcGingersnap]|nr:membrane protein [Rhodobacter phage RcGingersnap]QXN72301.1 membrane protein [Rhodobacter phage RcSalem]UUV43444.1 membrane protein [Rhodobacter phage RcExplorer]
MNNKSNTSSSSGIGFTGLLTILFIGLKLTGYITWSWWWVLSPIWITFLIVMVIVMVAIWASTR